MRLTPFHEEKDITTAITVSVDLGSNYVDPHLATLGAATGKIPFTWSGHHSLRSSIDVSWWWSKTTNKLCVVAIDRSETMGSVFNIRQLSYAMPAGAQPLDIALWPVAEVQGEATLHWAFIDRSGLIARSHFNVVAASHGGIELLPFEVKVGQPETIRRHVTAACAISQASGDVHVLLCDDSTALWRVSITSATDEWTEVQLFTYGKDKKKGGRGWNIFSRSAASEETDNSDPTGRRGIRSIVALGDDSVAVAMADQTFDIFDGVTTTEASYTEPTSTGSQLGPEVHEGWCLATLSRMESLNAVAATWHLGEGSGYVVQLLSIDSGLAELLKLEATGSAEWWGPRMQAVPQSVTAVRSLNGKWGAHVLWSSQSQEEDAAVVSLTGLAADVDPQDAVYYVSSSASSATIPQLWSISSTTTVESVVQIGEHVTCFRMNEQGWSGASVLVPHSMSAFDGDMSKALDVDQPHGALWNGEGTTYGIPAAVTILIPPTVASEVPVAEGEEGEAFSSAVQRVFLEGLRLIEDVPEAVLHLQSLFEEAVTDPVKAATSGHFSELSSRVLFYSYRPTCSEEEMIECVKYVLRSFDHIEHVYPTFSRRYIYHSAVEELTHRLATLVTCHLAWISSGSSYAVSPVLDTVRFAFQVLGGALKVVRALGSSTCGLGSTATPQGVAVMDHSVLSNCLNVITKVTAPQDYDEQPLLDVLTIASSLIRDASSLTEDSVACALKAFTSVWRSRFPLLYHFDIIVTAHAGAITGSNSVIIAHQIKLATAAVDRSMGGKVISTGILLRDLVADQDIANEMIELMAPSTSLAADVYRVSLLRRFITRMDPFQVVSKVDMSVLDPSLVASAWRLQVHLRSKDGDEGSVFGDFLRCLLDDVAILQLRVAVEELDTLKAVRLLLELLKTPDSVATVEHFAASLVMALLEKDQGMDLVDIPIDQPDLLQIFSHQLFSQVVRPKTSTSDREERERKRESNTMVLYTFLVNSGALGVAARVVYDVAVAMRGSPKCTSLTLSYALRAMALCVSTLRLIADTLPPKGGEEDDAPGMEDDNPFAAQSKPFSSVTEASMYMQSRNYATLEPLCKNDLPGILKQEHQLRCEFRLLTMGRSCDMLPFGEQGLDGPTNVLRGLLQVREWAEALSFALTWGLDLTQVFNTHASELLDGTAGPSHEGWETLRRRLIQNSNAENNYKYIRSTITFIVSHAKMVNVDECIPALLHRVDPSGLIAIYLAGKVGTTLARKVFEITVAYISAVQSGQWEEHGFRSTGVVITGTVLDRVAELAAKIVQEGRANHADLRPDAIAIIQWLERPKS